MTGAPRQRLFPDIEFVALSDIECVASGIGGGQQAVEVTFQTRAVDATLQMGAVDRTLQMGAPGSLMRDATTAIVTTAKHNYVAQAPDELSLVKGAVIYVYPNEVEVSVLMSVLVSLFMSLLIPLLECEWRREGIKV